MFRVLGFGEAPRTKTKETMFEGCISHAIGATVAPRRQIAEIDKTRRNGSNNKNQSHHQGNKTNRKQRSQHSKVKTPTDILKHPLTCEADCVSPHKLLQNQNQRAEDP